MHMREKQHFENYHIYMSYLLQSISLNLDDSVTDTPTEKNADKAGIEIIEKYLRSANLT